MISKRAITTCNMCESMVRKKVRKQKNSDKIKR